MKGMVCTASVRLPITKSINVCYRQIKLGNSILESSVIANGL